MAAFGGSGLGKLFDGKKENRRTISQSDSKLAGNDRKE